jgi:hypothetical protein
VAFLLPIPITLALGLLWAWWTSRPARPADPVVTVEEWSRAVRVLAQPPALPAQRSHERELAHSA